MTGKEKEIFMQIKFLKKKPNRHMLNMYRRNIMYLRLPQICPNAIILHSITPVFHCNKAYLINAWGNCRCSNKNNKRSKLCSSQDLQGLSEYKIE